VPCAAGAPHGARLPASRSHAEPHCKIVCRPLPIACLLATEAEGIAEGLSGPMPSPCRTWRALSPRRRGRHAALRPSAV